MLTIRKLMHDAGLTQQELAELADVLPSSICGYVNGKVKPQDKNLKKLADALDWKRDPNLLFAEANDYGEGYGQERRVVTEEEPEPEPEPESELVADRPTGNEIRQLIAEFRHSETMLESAQNALDKAQDAYRLAKSNLNDALDALD
jgi:transcriptional regulator with XRE-family HTH domain